MDKSQMRVRPGFVLGLVLIFAFAYFIALLTPNGGGKKKAQIINTHFEIKDIASVLNERADATGSLSNIDSNFISQTLFGTNTIRYSYRTNADGHFLDIWETPYKIEILGQINFIVRSAGPNKNFGDADDIVFNSVSNDFVKP